MTDKTSATPLPTPSRQQLLKGLLATVAGALVLLVLVVLPAEYGIDPTGFGAATGLSDLAAPPAVTITIRDVSGGNETLREVEIPDAGTPTPLPNPAVFQKQEAVPRTQTLRIEIPAGGETEVKTKLQEGKVVLYDWTVEQGDVYVDSTVMTRRSDLISSCATKRFRKAPKRVTARWWRRSVESTAGTGSTTTTFRW